MRCKGGSIAGCRRKMARLMACIALMVGAPLPIAPSPELHAAEDRDAFARPLFLKTAYESLTLPGDESMGMLGIGIGQELDEHFSASIQTWTAVRGDRGGFITIGLNGGYHTPLAGRLGLEAVPASAVAALWCVPTAASALISRSGGGSVPA